MATATWTASTRWWCRAASRTATTCAGAIARFSPLMESVIEFAGDGGPVLGICNGFQVLCEAACSRARCCRTTRCASSRGRSIWSSRPPTRSSRAPASRATAARCPVKHTTGRYHAPGIAEEQVVLRYAQGQNPNGAQDDIAGVCNAGGQRPRADAPSGARGRPLTGSADGGRLFESLAMVARVSGGGRPRAPHRELGLTDSEYEGIASAWGASRTRSSWRCSRSCGPSTAPTSTRRSCCGGCRRRGRTC